MDKIFSEFCGGMQVVLKRQDSKKAEIALKKAEIAQETTQETAQETTQEKLSEIELSILSFIRQDPTISRRVLAERVGLSPDGVKYHLNALKEKAGLRHEGPTKRGRWVID